MTTKKHHTAGTYPMYLTEKIITAENGIIKELELSLYHTDEINVGDTYTHTYKDNDFTVSKVLEHRFPAKGNHAQETHWYHLLLTR